MGDNHMIMDNFSDDLGNNNNNLNNVDQGQLLRHLHHHNHHPHHHQHHHDYDESSFKHYPVFVHTYKKSDRKSLFQSWPDTVIASLPSIFLILLTTPMLMTLLLHILKHIFVIKSILTQNMLGPTNMNARDSLDTKIGQLTNNLDRAIMKFETN
uniref:Lateral signaling target protein 2 homolog n=2 Tax=Dermatophagoides pteronyssinus TaxID=6956 RepID=A0A6P6YKT8_DERPT|nr:lateral signaling target protein 2 homolog [Dermatophagoides pteronyssinus]